MRDTTRERIADHLRESAATPTDLAAVFPVDSGTAVEHVRHLARSLAATDEALFVAPPVCRDCGFDDPADVPSRCPDSRREDVAQPAFRSE